MSLDFGGISTVAYHADNDRALAMFATALKIASGRSTAVAQLLECANRALAVGETQLDSVRLDGVRATDEDVEVRPPLYPRRTGVHRRQVVLDSSEQQALGTKTKGRQSLDCLSRAEDILNHHRGSSCHAPR